MDAVIPSLLEALAPVPDPRHRRGCRYSVAAILMFAVCAMVSGARSLYAIAQWGRDQGSAQIRGAFGITRATTPSVATVFRVFRDLDRDAFERVLAEWPASRGPFPRGRWRWTASTSAESTANRFRACIWWPPSRIGMGRCWAKKGDAEGARAAPGGGAAGRSRPPRRHGHR